MEKKNVNNILYGIIGVATLMLAVIGATFAYYTATQTNSTSLTGNMATISFDLSVTKVLNTDTAEGGMIPMSNNMVEVALSKNVGTEDGKGVCVDDNGNAVCQVYKITVSNTSTASMFLDGYVTLSGGSRAAADIPSGYTVTNNETTMRWAQAFCSETSGIVTSCTTAGTSTVRATNAPTWTALGISDTAKGDGANLAEIKTSRTDVTYAKTDETNAAVIGGNKYEVIKQNYIRLSDHDTTSTAYTRAADTTSALVYNQYLDAASTSITTDAQDYYIVVWLSETGTNQTAGATIEKDSAGGNGDEDANNDNKIDATFTNPAAANFFSGSVTFISAQGSEVTATFAGTTKVTPNT